MSKRARYTGNPPGREIHWPPGAIYQSRATTRRVLPHQSEEQGAAQLIFQLEAWNGLG